MTTTNQPSPKLSELFFDRLDLIGMAGDRIVAAMKAEGRIAPTNLEKAGLTLLQIDHDRYKAELSAAVRDEGKRLWTLDYACRERTPGITLENSVGRNIIWLYGTIGGRFGGLSANDFREAFIEVGNADIRLHIHSDGGDFLEALAMIQVINAHQGWVDAHIDGLAASAASLVAASCRHVAIADGALLMIHEASANYSGGADDFDEAAEQLRATNRTIANIYAPRWKGTREQLMDALKKETWLNAQQAVEAGLADEISKAKAIAAKVDERHRYKRLPTQLAIAAKANAFPELQRAQLWLHRIWQVR